MLIIKHRVNTIENLLITPKEYGVEIDLRSYKNRIIINHEPFENGVIFLDWLKYYQHKFLILNVKEEGLEKYILDIVNNQNIKNFFLLDQSMPFLIKTVLSGESRTALRVSEYESLETALKFKNKAKWIWVDHFSHFPLQIDDFKKLKNFNFKICIVSPELQGFNYEAVENIKNKLFNDKYIFDAVCTKFPELWKT